MAGIIKRFGDIMSANINALLDKAEDPAKMIEQYLRNLENDLGKVKAETAAIMAGETRARRELDECKAEVDKLQKYAKKALLAGNEEDARAFLLKKNQMAEKQAELQKAYDMAAENASKMRSMHDKLVHDIHDLNGRKDAVKAKVAAAKAKEKLNKIGAGISGAINNISAFDRMEAKADKMMDEANAMSELNREEPDETEVLMNKYDDTQKQDVEDELAALKDELGL